MDDTSKYLIHARIVADGVVERSDVVGAVFGQTEGLLGDELDLRDLQQSSKVGRIDVQIDSENGQSFGELTIATSLDKVETAILAASLETIERVGPCRSGLEVTEIEDVRAAKRREVVSRAKELLATAFDESVISSQELLEEVRQSVRVENITDHEGLPAGPRVADSDAIIVVEGRADVLQLLKYGIKNAIAVEGTNVPDAVARLTEERTVTAFLDGDRGGELILRELAQVGDVDYVAFAPPGRSVEDLTRKGTLTALREKVPYDLLADEANVREAVSGLVSGGAPPEESPNEGIAPAEDPVHPPTESSDSTDSTDPAAPNDATTNGSAERDRGADDAVETPAGKASVETPDADGGADAQADAGADGTGGAAPETNGETPETDAEPDETDAESDDRPATLRGHVRAVIEERTELVRLLDGEYGVLVEADADEAADALDSAATAPFAVVLDGELTQRLLDVAAQRGVDHVVARSTGEFVKKPVGTRVLTAEQLRAPELEAEA